MTAAPELTQGYARAVVEGARAQDVLDRVEDELFNFARAVQGNAELRERLGDERVAPGERVTLIQELIGSQAHAHTVAVATYLVLAGHVRELPEIADAVAGVAAAARNQSVAEVRSAVPLDDDQRARLAAALERTTGKAVSLKVLVDPRVVGGLVVTMDDTVIDGSVARNLAELRTALTGV